MQGTNGRPGTRETYLSSDFGWFPLAALYHTHTQPLLQEVTRQQNSHLATSTKTDLLMTTHDRSRVTVRGGKESCNDTAAGVHSKAIHIIRWCCSLPRVRHLSPSRTLVTILDMYGYVPVFLDVIFVQLLWPASM